MDATEFRAVLDRNQLIFQDMPLVYLKEMVQFLNQKVHVDLSDVTFASRPETYPLKVVSRASNLFKDATTKFETIRF